MARKRDEADEAEQREREACIAAAEPQFWAMMTREMEMLRTPESVLYLRKLLRAVPMDVKRDGSYRRVRFAVQERLSDYHVRYNANTGEQMSWHFAALGAESGTAMSAEEGLEVATKAASPGEGAVLEFSGYEDVGGNPVFRAVWGHVHGDVPVEGDYIHVLVNGKTKAVFAVYRRWHDVKAEPTVR